MTVEDVADLAKDVLRHRLVLSYDALADGATADALLEQHHRRGRRAARRRTWSRSPPDASSLAGPSGTRADPHVQALRRLGLDAPPQGRRAPARRPADPRDGRRRDRARAVAAVRAGRRRPPPGPGRVSARTGEPHVRRMVPERAITTWVVVDVSPSMAFGTTTRLKSDVAEGAADVDRPAGHRHGGSVSLDRRRRRRGAGRSRPRAASTRWPRCGARWRRASRPTACAATSARALARAGRLAADAGRRRRRQRLPRRGLGDRRCGVLAARHSVIAVEVRDPMEDALPDAGVVAFVDPETGDMMDLDTSDRATARPARAGRGRAPRARRRRAALGGRAARRRCAPTTTGCASWGGCCDELPRPRPPARAAGDPAGLVGVDGLAGAAAPVRRAPAGRRGDEGDRAARGGGVARWRRILPAALVGASAVSLSAAYAKPQHTVNVPVEKASVVLVSDESGSMAGDRRLAVAAAGRAVGGRSRS